MIGRLTISADGKPWCVYALAHGGTIQSDINGRTFSFALDTHISSGDVPPIPPPRELEDMATHEVAEYLATRIKDEREDRRWDGYGEDL